MPFSGDSCLYIEKYKSCSPKIKENLIHYSEKLFRDGSKLSGIILLIYS